MSLRFDSGSARPKAAPRRAGAWGIFAVLTTFCAALWITACDKTSPQAAADAAAPAATATAPAAAPGPIDWRHWIRPEDYKQISETPNGWISADVEPPFAFDELIYSWRIRLEDGQGFRLWLQVVFGPGDESPWLYAGYWGEVNLIENRERPEFDRGRVEMDQLLLKQKAVAFRFKAVEEGAAPLETPPALHVITTDNAPTSELYARFAPKQTKIMLPSTLLDLPLRRQISAAGEPLPDRCQSAALASALEYFGRPMQLDDIIPLTNDPEYQYPGIWPRTIGAACQLGFDAYIDRFRDWNSVRKALLENKVILVSMKMPADGDYTAPPYESMSGHIVALNGLTDDGRVVVTDSALGKSGRGYRCQWLAEDFEKVWMKTKGGVGMVICPPEGAAMRKIEDLPPFPANRGPKGPIEPPQE